MPKGVYVRTKKVIVSEETKLKVSEALKKQWATGVRKIGWKHTEQWKKEQSIRLKGKIRSEITSQKISIALTGKKLSQEHKENIRRAHIGLKISEKHRENLSIAAKKRNAKPPVMKGKNNPKWIEDRSLLKTAKGSEERRSSRYKDWRKQICNRDKWGCKINNKSCKGRLEVHHILGFTEYPELKYDINNGITLCHAHHPRKRAEEKRLESYFMELVSVSK